MTLRLLGGLTPRTFLRRYWQKRPLFVRGALPAFRGVVDEHALAALAARDDVESRLVERSGRRWNTAYGPFTSASLKKINSTLLVSGVNLHLEAADRLLRRFDFVPQARLDDVMVSFATRGGGVGPHVDSYDVFLLQASGRRRWRVGRKTYVVEPGDLRGLPDAAYRDPRLEPTSRPAQIPREMIRFARTIMEKVKTSRTDASAVLGQYLTTPKPHVVFRPGRSQRPLARAEVQLDPKTQLLYSGKRFYLNGECITVGKKDRALLKELADRRHLPGARLARAALADLVYDWQRAGYVRLKAVT